MIRNEYITKTQIKSNMPVSEVDSVRASSDKRSLIFSQMLQNVQHYEKPMEDDYIDSLFMTNTSADMYSTQIIPPNELGKSPNDNLLQESQKSYFRGTSQNEKEHHIISVEEFLRINPPIQFPEEKHMDGAMLYKQEEAVLKQQFESNPNS